LKVFQASLIFASKARAYTSGAPYTLRYLQIVDKLEKTFPGANGLAYSAAASVTKMWCFLLLIGENLVRKVAKSLSLLGTIL